MGRLVQLEISGHDERMLQFVFAAGIAMHRGGENQLIDWITDMSERLGIESHTAKDAKATSQEKEAIRH